MSRFNYDKDGNLISVEGTVYHPNGPAARDEEGRLIDGPRAGEIDAPDAPASSDELIGEALEAAADRIGEIVSAITTMRERGDPEDWTPTGKPKLMPLETLLGYQITQAERDAAWRLVLSDGSTNSATTES